MIEPLFLRMVPMGHSHILVFELQRDPDSGIQVMLPSVQGIFENISFDPRLPDELSRVGELDFSSLTSLLIFSSLFLVEIKLMRGLVWSVKQNIQFKMFD